jgi:hypothetical protein
LEKKSVEISKTNRYKIRISTVKFFKPNFLSPQFQAQFLQYQYTSPKFNPHRRPQAKQTPSIQSFPEAPAEASLTTTARRCCLQPPPNIYSDVQVKIHFM